MRPQLHVLLCSPLSKKRGSPTCPRTVLGGGSRPTRARRGLRNWLTWPRHLCPSGRSQVFTPGGAASGDKHAGAQTQGYKLGVRSQLCTQGARRQREAETQACVDEGRAPRCAEPAAPARVTTLRCARGVVRRSIPPPEASLGRGPPSLGRHPASINSPPPKIWSNRTLCSV